MFCFCWVMAGKPCVLFLLGGGWKAMCFVSAGWWLESHVFCNCLFGGGWIAIISFNVCIFLQEESAPKVVSKTGISGIFSGEVPPR